ncbi:hypothetical protein [Stratiformator vulcanicus]|uniref:Uncharacterized protein n=1 Tax=Stratiformator vulcanicus TaxID=2527980 RepID=A0A517R1I1_9PLAN|nr:hypothetical protein [Stratiformator vulcanicus]QDT37700.1 hypothetical protein Pan189_20820 [Stratiformator vulcanicus]
MFNPFSAEVMQPVVANLERSLKSHPREIIVLYYNPRHAEVLDQAASFELHMENGDWRMYGTLPVKSQSYGTSPAGSVMSKSE